MRGEPRTPAECGRDPLARRIHRLLARRVLHQEPVLLGTEHLAAVAGKPVVIVANHLSYSDANLLEVLLHQAGAAELGERLTVVAGPKVYSNLRPVYRDPSGRDRRE